MSSPLSSRVKKGASLSIGLIVLKRFASFGTTLFTARLLSKGDFGMFALAMTVIDGVRTLSDFGLTARVVAQTYDDDAQLQEELDAVWTIDMARRVLTSIAICALIPVFTAFYHEPRLASVLLISCWVPCIDGLGNIGFVYLAKKLDFAKSTQFGAATTILSSAVTITLAFVTRSFWALVWAQVVTTTLTVIMSYAWYRRRPRFLWRLDVVKSSLNYGKFVLVTTICSYITLTADNIIVGRYLGIAVLGGYDVAYSLANVPVTIIASVLGPVLFPAFSELATDGARLREAFLKSLTMGSFFMALLSGPLWVLSDEALGLLYGNKWAGFAGVLSVLLTIGYLRGLLMVITSLYRGLNRPELDAQSKFVESILFLSMLPLLTSRYGIYGAAWAGVVVYSLSFLLRFWMSGRVLDGLRPQIAGVVIRGAFACGLSALVGLTIHRLLPHSLVGFMLTIAAMWLVSIVAYSVLFERFRKEVRPHLRKLRTRMAA